MRGLAKPRLSAVGGRSSRRGIHPVEVPVLSLLQLQVLSAHRKVHSCVQSGKNIVLTVQDNGKGIPKALHKKVFEPFYTTARDKGGTGLGLNILYNLVRQKVNGEIELTSAPNEGTAVTIFIPVESETSVTTC